MVASDTHWKPPRSRCSSCVSSPTKWMLLSSSVEEATMSSLHFSGCLMQRYCNLLLGPELDTQSLHLPDQQK